MANRNPKGSGRKLGSKNVKPVGVRITPTVRVETKAWLNNHKLSIGKAIDLLVAAEVERQRGE